MTIAIGSRRPLFILLIATIVFAPRPVPAQVGIFLDPADPNVGCNTVSGVWHGYIIVTDGWKGARFSLPAQGTCDTAWSAEVADGVTAVGDFATGIELTLPSCAQERTVLAVITAGTAPSAPGCCPFGLQPHEGAASVELIGCESGVVPAAWTLTAWAAGPGSACFPRFMPPPRDPYPPDGATHVALDADLTWRVDRGMGCHDLGQQVATVFFGTNASPPGLDETGFQTIDPGELQPETTYYWRISARDYGAYASSPVWSFTTTTGTAVRQSTWGHVKALYR